MTKRGCAARSHRPSLRVLCASFRRPLSARGLASIDVVDLRPTPPVQSSSQGWGRF